MFWRKRLPVSGERNQVVVEEGADLSGLTFTLRGDDNFVRIAATIRGRITVLGNGNRLEIEPGYFEGLRVGIQDDGNSVLIAEGCQVTGDTGMTAREGTSIAIGRGCMIAAGVNIRTHDGHAITDLEGQRINPAADVILGERVWVGMNSTLLKGAYVPDNCIVGAHSLVTRRFDSPNCIIAGNPAKVIRSGVDWR